MNPIFQNQKQNSFKGIANPRESVLNAISNMNQAQKQRLLKALPVAQSIANKQGIDITNVVNELQSRM